MKKLFTTFLKSKRVNVFILFFSLALMFSILSKLSSDYTKTLTYTLKPINVPEEFVIVSDSLHKLNVTVETYGFKYISYYFSSPELKIDFKNLDKDKSSYIWIERAQLSSIVAQFDSKIKIKAVNPDTIYFKYDTNFTKRIPVFLDENLEFASGFDITHGYKIEPDSIKIIGPKLVLDTINEMITKPLILQNVNKSISKVVDFKIPDSYKNLKYSHTSATISADVEKFTEGSLDVPVSIINVPENVSVNHYPKTVTILFNTSLSNYKIINKTHFTVQCDFNEINENNSFLTPKIVKQPELIKNVRMQTKKVEFILSQ